MKVILFDATLRWNISYFTATLQFILTEYPKISDLLQGPPEVAARLEAASIRVNVNMANRLLDPDAEAQGPPREGVEDVHEVSVIRRETPMGVHPLKVRTSWVQTCRWRRGEVLLD